MPSTPSALFLIRKIPDYFLSLSLKHNEIKQVAASPLTEPRVLHWPSITHMALYWGEGMRVGVGEL